MNRIVPMNEQYARAIMKWKYEGDLSIYNLDDDEDTLQELLTQEYYAVLDDKKEVFGFFCVKDAAIVPYGKDSGVYDDTDYLDIGLGMNPQFVGLNKGYHFMKMAIDFFRIKYKTDKFRLTVFDFNKRAIHLYKKIGFRMKSRFKSKIGYYFYVMTLN